MRHGLMKQKKYSVQMSTKRSDCLSRIAEFVEWDVKLYYTIPYHTIPYPLPKGWGLSAVQMLGFSSTSSIVNQSINQFNSNFAAREPTL